MRSSALVLAAFAACAVAEKNTRGVLKANPLPHGFCGNAPSETGYFEIDSNTNKNYFYWSASAQSGASNAPTVLWMTGGPGCSSLLALLMENGPCQIGSGPNPAVNPFGWNQNATVIWLDQPAGVGFSYANAGGYDHNQTQVSADVYRFLQAWFQAHPAALDNDFYIFAESYGGHYAPSSANAVFQGNSNIQPGDVYIPLKGVGIGNGLTDPLVQYQYYGEMAYNYSIIKQGKPVIQLSDYEAMQAAWPECQQKISDCQADTSKCADAQDFCDTAMFTAYENTGQDVYNIEKPCAVPPLCTDMTPITTFLNSAATQKTLGVAAGITWQTCNYDVNGDFANDWMKNFQQDLIPLLNNGTRVLIYSGDLDWICNWLGNQAWTLSLPWNGQSGFNAAPVSDWHVAGAVAGSYRTYNGFTFLRVTDAGHMVPSDQPQAALSLLNTMIFNQNWS